MKVKEYRILKELDTETLQSRVNQGIKEGWQPLGAPIAWIASTQTLMQVMVLFDDEEVKFQARVRTAILTELKRNPEIAQVFKTLAFKP